MISTFQTKERGFALCCTVLIKKGKIVQKKFVIHCLISKIYNNFVMEIFSSLDLLGKISKVFYFSHFTSTITCFWKYFRTLWTLLAPIIVGCAVWRKETTLKRKVQLAKFETIWVWGKFLTQIFVTIYTFFNGFSKWSVKR